eukprot:TRINITY_DN6395_c0_g1_i3.p1 TRINITY_DN6395_c0_g1~~TRINITY_DN6395_c0_g1_i3.p1  ORF type:complete len:180 (-),score=32.49 TRINITY_DN6395_c0_g1_i3:2-541(-)
MCIRDRSTVAEKFANAVKKVKFVSRLKEFITDSYPTSLVNSIRDIGLTQEPIGHPQNEQILRDPHMFDDLKEGLSKITGRLPKILNDNFFLRGQLDLTGEADRLSEHDMRVIREAFASDIVQVNKVDPLFKRLVFFSKFPENVRKKVYASSKLVTYPKGRIIFKQGDYGDALFLSLIHI